VKQDQAKGEKIWIFNTVQEKASERGRANSKKALEEGAASGVRILSSP